MVDLLEALRGMGRLDNRYRDGQAMTDEQIVAHAKFLVDQHKHELILAYREGLRTGYGPVPIVNERGIDEACESALANLPAVTV